MSTTLNTIQKGVLIPLRETDNSIANGQLLAKFPPWLVRYSIPSQEYTELIKTRNWEILIKVAASEICSTSSAGRSENEITSAGLAHSQFIPRLDFLAFFLLDPSLPVKIGRIKN